MRAGIKRTLAQLKNTKLAGRALVGKTGTFSELGEEALSKIKSAKLSILPEDIVSIKKLDKGIVSIAGNKRGVAETAEPLVKKPTSVLPGKAKPSDSVVRDAKTIDEAMAKLKGSGVTPPSPSTREPVSLSGNPQSVVQDVVQDVVQETISNPQRVAEQAKKTSQGQGAKLDSGGVTQGQKRMYNAVTKGSAVSAMFIAGTGILDAMHTSVKNNNARRRNEEQLKEQEKKQREAREKNRKRNRRNANYNQSHTMGSIVFDMFNDRTGHHLMGNNRF